MAPSPLSPDACGTHAAPSSFARYKCKVDLAHGVELHFDVVIRALYGLVTCSTAECSSWLGLGFPRAPGKMIGATAVVMLPGGGPVSLMQLTGKDPSMVAEAPVSSRVSWNLRDAATHVVDGRPAMQFTVDLPSTMALDSINLIFAGGATSTLTYHRTARGSFTLNLLGYHFAYPYLPPPALPLVVPPSPPQPLSACADERLEPRAGYKCSVRVDSWLNLYYRLSSSAGGWLDARVECATCTGYLGFGFAAIPGGMIGSTAIIGANDPPTVKLYRLNGKSPAAVRSLDDALQVLADAQMEISSPRGVVMSFNVTLGQSGVPADLSAAQIVYSSGSTFALGYHVRRGATTIAFEADPLPPPSPEVIIGTDRDADAGIANDDVRGLGASGSKQSNDAGTFALIGCIAGFFAGATVFAIALKVCPAASNAPHTRDAPSRPDPTHPFTAHFKVPSCTATARLRASS